MQKHIPVESSTNLFSEPGSELSFGVFDTGSPLRDASLAVTAGESFCYDIDGGEGGSLLVAEEKARGKWNKGKAETEEERTARIEAQRLKSEETHQKVEAGLADLAASLAEGKSDTFLALLNSMSRFHHYSWGNTILIAFQRPDATMVAGFTTWKSLGRYVKSGERGIVILAPIPKRLHVEAEEGSTGDNGDQEGETKGTKTIAGRGVWGFKAAHVFDVSQTEGKPLPEFATTQGDPAHYLPLLEKTVEAAGITLAFQDHLGGAFGRSHIGKIELLCGMPPAQEFATLVHEFAHELLHPLTERREISKTVKETEAEAVAYVVSRAVGLEPGTASSDYIQLYRGDTTTLAASLERIQKTADRILSNLQVSEAGLLPDAASYP